jgi:hypothetical protein
MPHSDSPHPEAELDLEEQIVMLEQDAIALKERYHQVMLAEREQVVLVRERNRIQQGSKIDLDSKQELDNIRERLAELDFTLESRLVDLWEPFWIGVRFGGLGIGIGWLLCSFVTK